MQVMNKSNQIQDKNKNKKSVTVLATICIMVAFALVASPIIITKNAFSFDELKRESVDKEPTEKKKSPVDCTGSYWSKGKGKLVCKVTIFKF